MLSQTAWCLSPRWWRVRRRAPAGSRNKAAAQRGGRSGTGGAALLFLVAAGSSAGLPAEDIPANPDCPRPGLELGADWWVEPWGNAGRIEKLAAPGRTVLKLTYQAGEKERAAFRCNAGLRAPPDRVVKLWVYSPSATPPAVALAVTAGAKYAWHEARPAALRQGWNALAVPLTAPHWKTEASRWEFTAGVEPLDEIRAVVLIVHNGASEGWLLVEGFAPEAPDAQGAAADAEAAWAASWKRLARLGRGFVVWQSNRTGQWRIWRRGLDGGDERPLSPAEAGRGHFCPRVAPDGATVAYLSVPRGLLPTAIGPAEVEAPLRAVGAGGSGDRVLVPNARANVGGRAVVWVNARELIYISPAHETRHLDLASGADKVLIRPPAAGDPWLLDATRTYAARGHPPCFSRYEPRTQGLYALPAQSGCQPCFNHDGRWAVWVAASGGPLARLYLATGEAGQLVGFRDPRMPPRRSYVYFPSVSRCGRLLAFAASPDQFDFWSSDYDVFVAELDPRNMELKDRPVRYTFEPHADTFPDVYLAPLELGDHRGEAPYRIELRAPRGGEWEWEFGEGRPERGAAGVHVYEQPGEYAVRARRGEETRQGLVCVAPSAAPVALRADAVGEREVRVDFSEEVDFRDLACGLASGAAIASHRAGEDGRSLLLTFARKPPLKDKLWLEGVWDRAQRPNRMGRHELPLYASPWPSERRGLVFLWESAYKPNLVPAAGAGATARSSVLQARGKAILDGFLRMQLSDGAFLTRETEPLIRQLRAANELTVEATLTPDAAQTARYARIVVCSAGPDAQNFALVQDGEELLWRLCTSDSSRVLRIGPVPPCRASHVVVTYRSGAWAAYLDGAKAASSDQITGDFAAWEARPLCFGDEATGRRAWAGRLEGVAVYSRVLSEEEVRLNGKRYRALTAGRAAVEPLIVEAVLRLRSAFPTPEKIFPYREALVHYEYSVEKVLAGQCAAQRLQVVHWAVLDGQALAIRDRPLGARVRLTLEPLEANPQLARIWQRDDLPVDADVPVYYDPSR